jgi:hypothetical protein
VKGRRNGSISIKSFHDRGVSVEPRDPIGDRRKLAADAIKLGDGSYDQVWVVFDLDHDPARGKEQLPEFDATIAKAREASIRVAYSVDDFELWFVLHYAYVNSRQERSYNLRREHEVKTFASRGDRKGSPLLVVGGRAVFAGANTFSHQVTDGSILPQSTQ